LAALGCKNVLAFTPIKQIMSPVNQTTHFEELNSLNFGALSHGME
jgi:hypothetical protein